MKKLILTIAILSITTLAHAGACVCHDGAGSITKFDWDGDYGYCKNTADCVYYSDADFNALKIQFEGVPRKYIKWDNGPTEMTQAEKDALDQAAEDAALVSAKTSAKANLDSRHWRAFIDILIDEINTLRQQHGLTDRTIQQLKIAIENRIDQGSQ